LGRHFIFHSQRDITAYELDDATKMHLLFPTRSPKKLRLTYAGVLDACKIIKAGGKDKNELYVFDVEKQAAQRIAAAVSLFQSLWLDEDRLVYENGVGKDGKLGIYSFVDHAAQMLPTRFGAGLFGVPSLACEEQAPPEEGAPPEIAPPEEGAPAPAH
jgi:hypothetical protein